MRGQEAELESAASPPDLQDGAWAADSLCCPAPGLRAPGWTRNPLQSRTITIGGEIIAAAPRLLMGPGTTNVNIVTQSGCCFCTGDAPGGTGDAPGGR